MAEYRRYSLTEGKIKKSGRHGFVTDASKNLILVADQMKRYIFFPAFCSGETDYKWGRLSFQPLLASGMHFSVLLLAVNEEKQKYEEYILQEGISPEQKKEFLLKQGGIERKEQSDLLLYDFRGAYLFCCLEVTGIGSGSINHFVIQAPGDNFMQTFPEIYQEEGGFFHRYMSVFSSIYNDFQRQIDTTHEWLDFEKAPMQLLLIYAQWLGLQMEEGILEEATLRILLKHLYELNKYKGTKKVVTELLRILLEEDVIVVERNLLEGYIRREEVAIYNRLYGENREDITVLIERVGEEELQAKLLFFLKQFVPIRSSISLVFYKECCSLDSYCYMDRNAKLCAMSSAILDRNKVLGESILLG